MITILFACLLPIASAFAPSLKVQPQDPRHSWVNRRTREISSAEVNVGLVRQLTLNQLLIGWTIWSGGEGAAVLARDAHFDSLLALPLGVLGVLPLIFISRKIERSESGVVADLNLSTNLLVLRLFGSEKQPVLALAASLFLACLTGLVEETTFRGEILPSLAQGNGLAGGAALSTALFAALHVNPKAPLEGKAPSRRLPRNLAPSLAAGAAARAGRAPRTLWSPLRFSCALAPPSALPRLLGGKRAPPEPSHRRHLCAAVRDERQPGRADPSAQLVRLLHVLRHALGGLQAQTSTLSRYSLSAPSSGPPRSVPEPPCAHL